MLPETRKTKMIDSVNKTLEKNLKNYKLYNKKLTIFFFADVKTLSINCSAF